MEFEKWLADVDAEVQARAGVSYKDLPDFLYRDAFDSGISATATAADVLAEAGFEDEE